ncbi:MAG TPA: hypothetical protein VJ914_19815 [Pseudonocardiaceae bacterium]|nr:hypothetical protein [Pseudonocardiaceae bacterium]
MNWAEQTEPQLGDLERTLADDPRWHASLRRLRAIMTLRQHFAGRRGPIAATGIALATAATLLVLGLWLTVPASTTAITALLAGCVLAGGIAFAVTLAVLDPRSVPPVREHHPR